MTFFRKVLTAFLTTLLILTAFATPVSAQTERLRMGITGDESTINPYTYVTGNPRLEYAAAAIRHAISTG